VGASAIYMLCYFPRGGIVLNILSWAIFVMMVLTPFERLWNKGVKKRSADFKSLLSNAFWERANVLHQSHLAYFLMMGCLSAVLAAAVSAWLASRIPDNGLFGFPELDQLHQPEWAIAAMLYIVGLGIAMGFGAWGLAPPAMGIRAALYTVRLLGPDDAENYRQLKEAGHETRAVTSKTRSLRPRMHKR